MTLETARFAAKRSPPISMVGEVGVLHEVQLVDGVDAAVVLHQVQWLRRARGLHPGDGDVGELDVCRLDDVAAISTDSDGAGTSRGVRQSEMWHAMLARAYYQRLACLYVVDIG